MEVYHKSCNAEASAFEGARHALLSCRSSAAAHWGPNARSALACQGGAGRPSLSSYACKTSLSMVPWPWMIVTWEKEQDLVLQAKKLLALQGSAYSAVLAPYHDNGLFANVLQASQYSSGQS